MSDFIMLPRSLLTTDAGTAWIYAHLLAIADENGHVEIRVNSWCNEIGVNRQMLRKALNQLVETNYITNCSTNKGANGKTNLTIVLPNSYIEGSPIIKPIIQPIEEPIPQPLITTEDSSVTKTRNAVEKFIEQLESTRSIEVEQFCMAEHMTADTFYRLAREVAAEWAITDTEHFSQSDMRRHLINHIRKKFRHTQSNSANGNANKSVNGASLDKTTRVEEFARHAAGKLAGTDKSEGSGPCLPAW